MVLLKDKCRHRKTGIDMHQSGSFEFIGYVDSIINEI
jgi:hypothetical protein